MRLIFTFRQYLNSFLADHSIPLCRPLDRRAVVGIVGLAGDLVEEPAGDRRPGLAPFLPAQGQRQASAAAGPGSRPRSTAAAPRRSPRRRPRRPSGRAAACPPPCPPCRPRGTPSPLAACSVISATASRSSFDSLSRSWSLPVRAMSWRKPASVGAPGPLGIAAQRVDHLLHRLPAGLPVLGLLGVEPGDLLPIADLVDQVADDLDQRTVAKLAAIAADEVAELGDPRRGGPRHAPGLRRLAQHVPERPALPRWPFPASPSPSPGRCRAAGC